MTTPGRRSGIGTPAACGVPSDAIALLTCIYTYQSNLNDHMVHRCCFGSPEAVSAWGIHANGTLSAVPDGHSFGRNASHIADPWDNRPFLVPDGSAWMNDVLLTQEVRCERQEGPSRSCWERR